MIEKKTDYVPYQIGQKYTLYLHPQHAPSLKIFASGILLLVQVIRFKKKNTMQPFLAPEGSKPPFFLTEICDLQRPTN